MQGNDQDYLVRATAADAQIRAFAVTTRNMTETARAAHNTSPIATAALGRLMSGAVMMGDMLKNDKDILTIQIDGDGPMKGLLATADSLGNVKGYVKNPEVVLPPNEQKHLNVGGAIGHGTMTVIRDFGMKDPYVGQIALHSGEIAEDLTWYFAESEQIPSSVGLGVLMSHENTVREAGGFIVQLMPFAEEETISHLEQNLQKIASVTDILKAGNTPEQMLQIVLEGFDVTFNGTRPVQFHCNCDRDRVERAIVLLGEKEIDSMIADGKEVELKCHFCGKAYSFSIDDLKELRKRAVLKATREEVVDEQKQ